MSIVTEGASITEMKPSKYRFVKKKGNNYIFINSEGVNENWRRIHFSRPGFVLKYKGMLFEFHSKEDEAA